MMTPIRFCALALALAGAAIAPPPFAPPAFAAEAIRMQPADPQPDAAALKPGLGVRYAYPPDIRLLYEAEAMRGYELETGEPIIGFDYPDAEPGQKPLTAKRAEQVVAFIDGYMRFDKPGVYKLEFQSNDGFRVRIGGVQVYEHDGRHRCGTNGWVRVEAPKAGWYAVEALYFQRYKTSCLLLEWEPPGEEMDWAPTDIYAHAPG